MAAGIRTTILAYETSGFKAASVQAVSSHEVESLTRNMKFLSLCKSTTQELIKACEEDPELLKEKNKDGTGMLLEAVKRNSVELCALLYKKDVSLFLSGEEELLDAFKEALFTEHVEVREWLYKKSPWVLHQRDRNGDTCMLWACRECKEVEGREIFYRIVKWCLANCSYVVLDEDKKTGERPFLIACSLGDLELAKMIYAIISIANYRDNSGETSLLKALKAPNGISLARWLLDNPTIYIESREEVRYLAKVIKEIGEELLLKIIFKTSHALLIPYMEEILEMTRNREVVERFKYVLESLPNGFAYPKAKGAALAAAEALPRNEVLEAEAVSVIDYYNTVIPDAPEIENPYQRLFDLFASLTEEDFLFNISMDKKRTLTVPLDHSQSREHQLLLCEAFLMAIGVDKKAFSIPHEIENPYQRVLDLFDGLTAQDLFLNITPVRRKELVGQLEAKRLEAKQMRGNQFSLCASFLDRIAQETPDKSIPVGQEEFYYRHLRRILKHLVLYLESARDSKKGFKEECFTDLGEIQKVSGTCYPNYSTLLHSMYGRISQDVSFVEKASEEDLPSQHFLSQMIAFYREKIKNKALSYLDGEDTHVASVLQRFFRDENIPCEVETIAYAHEVPALLDIRARILKVENISAQRMTDLQVYNATKALFIRKFNSEVNSIRFIYEGLEEFLLKNLNGRRSSDFLEKLRDWLEDKKIPAHALLDCNEVPVSEGLPVRAGEVVSVKTKLVYAIKPEGFPKLLEKLPKVIQL